MSQLQQLYVRLTEKYKCYPVLWDSNNKLYRMKNEREKAWKEISQELQLPISELKSKMKTLMGTYRSERSREKKSRNTGPGRYVYQSKWFLYTYFDFLMKKDTTVGALNVLNPESQETMEEGEGNDPLTTSQDTNTFQEGNDPPTISQYTNTSTFQSLTTISGQLTTRKVQKPKQVGADPELQTFGKPVRMLRSSSKVASDCHYAYSQYLAIELMRYDPSTLSCVKKAISDILFEADVGTLCYKYNCTPPPQAQSPQFISASSNQEHQNQPSAYQMRTQTLPTPQSPGTDVNQELPITPKAELIVDSCFATNESLTSQRTENHLEPGTIKEEPEYLDLDETSTSSTATSLEPNTPLTGPHDFSQIAGLEEDPLCIPEPKPEKTKQPPVQIERTSERDPINDFFQAMATSVKALPPLLQLQVKQKVTQAVFEAESEMLSMN